MRTLTVITLLLIFPFSLCAAINAGMVWEVRHAGTDNNGGGFDSTVSVPGTDFSQQNAAQIAYTDLVIGATTTQYTSAGNPVGATLPGNVVHIVSGAGCTTGWYEVLSNATTTATVDRSMGTAASTCTANLGGAIAAPGTLQTVMVAKNTAWIRNDANYSVGTGIDYTFCGTSGSTRIMGYGTTRGDGTHAVIQASASIRLIQIDCTLYIANLTLDCNGNAGQTALLFDSSDRIVAENMKLMGICGNILWFFGSWNTCINCEITGGNGSSNPVIVQGQGNKCIYCRSHGNASSGFIDNAGNSGNVYLGCISDGNTGGTSDGFFIDGYGAMLIGVVAYNNGRSGLRTEPGGAVSQMLVRNSIFVNNGAYGIDQFSGTNTTGSFNYNAYFGNTTAALHNVTAGANDVTLTGVPFTNAGSGDFSLNNTAGQGKALRGAGFPGALTSGGTGFIDIGALQSNGASSGSAFGFVQ